MKRIGAVLASLVLMTQSLSPALAADFGENTVWTTSTNTSADFGDNTNWTNASGGSADFGDSTNWATSSGNTADFGDSTNWTDASGGNADFGDNTSWTQLTDSEGNVADFGDSTNWTDSQGNGADFGDNTAWNAASPVQVYMLDVRNVTSNRATFFWTGYKEQGDPNTELTYRLCVAPTTQNVKSNCSNMIKTESLSMSNLTPNTNYNWTVEVYENGQLGTTLNGTNVFTTLGSSTTTSVHSVDLIGNSSVTSNSAGLTWNVINPTGSSTNYVCISPNRNTVFENCRYQTGSNTYTVTTLAPSTTYWWTVYSENNNVGKFSEEAPMSFTTTGTNNGNAFPHAYIHQVNSVTESTALLTWQKGDANGDTVTSKVCYSEHPALVARSCQAETSSTQQTLTGLRANSTYFWNVYVKDAFHDFVPAYDGPLSFTTSISTTNSNPSVYLNSPGNGSTISTNTVELRWNGSDPNNDTLTYRLYMRDVSGQNGSIFSNNDLVQSQYEIALTNKELDRYTVSLSPNRTYSWTVTVNDNRGGGEIFANQPFKFSTSNTLTAIGNLSADLYVNPVSGNTGHVTTYGDNNNMHLKIDVTNNTSSSVVLNFPTSQRALFTITGSNGQIYRQNTDTQAFTTGNTNVTIPANSTVNIANYTWDGRSRFSTTRTYTTYTVSAQLLASNQNFSIANETISLVQGNISTGGGTHIVVPNNSGSGFFWRPGTGGGNVDFTAFSMPSNDTDDTRTQYGPVRFDSSNGRATLRLLHKDVVSGFTAEMAQGTEINDERDDRPFEGTYTAPRRILLSSLPEPMRSKLPGLPELYSYAISYGDLNETFSEPVILSGNLPSDPRNLVANDSDIGIFAWEPRTDSWRVVGGVNNFNSRKFEVPITESTMIAFLNKRGSTSTGGTTNPGGNTGATTGSCRTTNPTSFADANNHWGSYYICRLVQKGALTGYTSGSLAGTFQPDRKVTRAELLKTMLTSAGVQVSTLGGNPFTDVNVNEWYAPYVLTAYRLGIVKGYADNTFQPHKEVNRAEALKMILLASPIFNEDGINAEFASELADADTFAGFVDVPESEWFAKYVIFAYKRGIINGKNDGRFHPEESMTRAEMSKVILLTIELTI